MGGVSRRSKDDDQRRRAQPGRWRVLALLTCLLLGAGWITAAQPSGAYAATTEPTVSVGPDTVVGEGDASVAVKISLSTASSLAISVDYTTNSGTACPPNCPGSEFDSTSGTATIPAGKLSTSVPVVLRDSAGITAMNFFTFTISSPTSGTIARATQMISIVPNSDLVATPGLFVRSATVDATTGSVSVPVLLGGPTGEVSNIPVTVHYATSDLSAIAGTDYTTKSGMLTFLPGETVQNINVPVLDASGSRPTRYFAITLSKASGAMILAAKGVVTIGASGANPVSSPSVSVGPDVVVGEGDGYVDLPITLSAPGTIR